MIVSYFIIAILTENYISFYHFFCLALSVLPVSLLFISMAMILSLYDKYNIGLSFVALFCVSIIQLSQIQIIYSIEEPIYYIPVFNMISNSRAFISPKYVVSFFPILMMYIISIFSLALSLYGSVKIINKIYER